MKVAQFKRKIIIIAIISLFIFIMIFLFYPKSSISIKNQKKYSKEIMGNGIWSFLHGSSVSKGVDPQNVLSLLESLRNLIPCNECRNHFATVLDENPFLETKITRENVALHICKLHNIVNKRVGKSQFPCDMEQIEERWSFGQQKCGA